jgi:hypothetical protein
MTLEGIFKPHARKQRDDFYAKSKRLVHYTSADIALKIIKTKRLWMRNTADFLRTLDRQIIIAQVFNMLLTGVTCVKHKGFEEEREWRAIYMPKYAASPLMISSTEVVGGVPQIIYQIPLDESVSPALAELDLVSMFDRLIVGPSPYPWVMYEAFADALAKAGVTDASNRVHSKRTTKLLGDLWSCLQNWGKVPLR